MRLTEAWPVKVATAPVDFGIYSAEDPVISAAEYARIAVDCGYEGTDLGSHGYLDEVPADRDVSPHTGPVLAGGWHDLRFGRQEGFAEDLAALEDTARLLHAAGWRLLVRHVNVKDATADGTFCRLGGGRLDLEAFLDALRGLEYEGWIVVEQDVPDGGQDVRQIVGDMRHNRAVLAGLGV